MSGEKQLITLGTYNIANNVFDEKSDEFRFIKRRDKIKTQIGNSACDVLFLQEVRKSSDQNRDFSVSPIMNLIAISGDYSIADFRPRNLGEMSFWTACLFNSNVKYVESFAEWLIEPHKDTSKESGRGIMALFVKFLSKSGKHFWVINGYLPTQNSPEMLDQKLQAIENLGEKVKNLSAKEGEETPIFYCGDQNTYFFGHNNVDLGDSKGAVTLMNKFDENWIQFGKMKTFKSFPHDTVQCFDSLDHFFLFKNKNQNGICGVWTLKDDNQASDHLLLQLNFLI
jgi:exonuclease III